MSDTPRPRDRGALPGLPAYVDPTASFSTLLARERPEALGGQGARIPEIWIAEATTVLALKYKAGVLIAGDRRATEGSFIAHRSIEKVFMADSHSAVAVAGAAGPAIETVRLFQTELEHYEKVQGSKLSLEGKANRLAALIRSNFAMATQGLIVIPVFAGYDLRREEGRIFRYDVTGGRYEENDYCAEGSGGRLARSYIKQNYDEGLAADDAMRIAIGALYEAADEDAGTGGPDLARGIYPTVAFIGEKGFESVEEAAVAASFEELLAGPEKPAGHRKKASGAKAAPEAGKK